MNLWTAGLAALAVLVALAVGGIWAIQRWGIYHFSHEVSTPAETGVPRARAVTFASEDGTPLTAWIADAEPGRPMIISFPGSDSNLADSSGRLIPLIELGYGLAMLQYRGMGDGVGRPSELNFAMDARAFYDQLDALTGVETPLERRVIHGFSLGSSVASRLASTRPSGAVVLEATFTKGCRYLDRRFKGLPICKLMWAEKNEIDTFVPQITAPILIVHGAKDRSVPTEWAQEVYDVANDPKEFVLFPEGGHSNLTKYGLNQEIDRFLTKYLPQGQTAPDSP